MNADDVRRKLVANFEAAKPILDGFYEYAKVAGALAQEYHEARIHEAFQGVDFRTLTLVASLDARETPVSLDKKLMELGQAPIKLVIFDQTKFTYYLFV